jgi:DNA-binding LacI/PurR family transcriptional regulator
MTMSDKPPIPPTNLTELALAAGVSPSTVSRALAGKSVVSPSTRDRIRDLAREHGFRLNLMARNLRLKRTQAISVAMPLGHETEQNLSDPFLEAMLGQLMDRVADYGHDLLLSRVIPGDDHWLERLADSGRVDGIIIIGQSDQSQALDRLAARYLPLVVWGAHQPGQQHCTVGVDNVAGGRIATEHLLAQGRRRLLFLGNPELPEFAQRYQGFCEACAAAGIEAMLAPTQLLSEPAMRQINRWLDTRAAPDGIVAASDVIALAALSAVAARGFIVPRDIAIIGYDDIALAAYASPGLSTIRQDIAAGARHLVDILFARIGGEAKPPVIMIPELVIRGSS